jgi:hypothetical protein
VIKPIKVFLDNNRPFLLAEIGNENWICKWHPDNKFVTFYKLKDRGYPTPNNLTIEEQNLYLKKAGLNELKELQDEKTK